MGTRESLVRLRLRAGAVLAAVLVVLVAPSLALAASTASFSSATPRPNASSVTSTPTLSVVVYDKYGVRGTSNYSMTVDGAVVRPSLSYVKGFGYKKLKLTYRVSTPLAVGLHTFGASVKDLRSKRSSYTWKYTVTTPPPPTFEQMPAGGTCTDCHVGFPAAHPMTNCAGCHSPTAPPRPAGSIYGPGTPMESYSPANLSAHTLSCALSRCHSGSAVFFPHTLDANCSRCHNPAYPAIPQLHATDASSIQAAHESTSTFCTNPYCHASSLTAEHYRYTVAGVRLSCVTCHGSSDPLVVAAIASGSTSCASCHGTAAFVHPDTTAVHAVTGTALTTCVRAGCHAADLSPVHGGRCDFCHGSDAPTAVKNAVASHDTNCVTCHGAITHTPLHDLPSPRADLCAGSGCHDGTNLTTLQIGAGPAAKHQDCSTCHDPGAPQVVRDAIAARNKDCSACHGSGLSSGHTSHVATVTVGAMVINGHDYGTVACATCHGNSGPGNTAIDLQKVPQHTSCATCHPSPADTAAKQQFTCDQPACHGAGTLKGGALVQHAGIGAAHDTTPGVVANCGGAGCHAASDVASIHDALGRPDHGCGICHDGSIVPAPTKDCAAASGCHPTYPVKPASHGSHVATVTAAAISINGVGYGTHACTECHASLDLQQVPQHTSCATCHPVPAGSALRGDFSCGQSACHGSGTLRGSAIPQHGNADAAHATTAGVTTNCGGSGCHTALTDVAAIHDRVPGRSDRGCGICHDGSIVATPTTNCSAASGCHPTYPVPDSSHASHVSTVTAAVITINGTPWGSHACSECHSPLELQSIHGGSSSCVKCHPSPASTVTSGTFACAQAGCHITPSGNMLAQHAAVNASHTTTSTASCVGTGCHTGGTDVAAIHGVTGGPGCAACHGVGKTPSLDCVTCHPTYPVPDSAHASHVSTVTAAVITINGTPWGSHSCSECHSPLELQSIHGGSSSCVKCHPSPASTVTSGTFACAQAGCHVTAAGNMLAQHAAVNASHTTTSTPTCVGTGCHTGGTDVAAIHGVTGGPGCAACHGAGKTPSLDCVTCHPTYPSPDTLHGSHVSTVTAAVIAINGTGYGSHACSECHSPLDLQAIHGGASSCVKCHPSPANTVTSGTFACAQAGCHVTPSGNMLAQHAAIDAAHTTTSTPTCVGTGCHTGGTDVAAIHAVTGGPGCAACHGAGKTPSLVCVTCHPTYPAGSGAHASHLSTVTAGVLSINGTSYGSHNCSECHTSLDLQVIHGGSSSCVKCHPNPASTVTSGTFACAQAGCHVTPSGNMHAQHGSIDASHTLLVAPSCVAAGCHTGGNDVAAIHAVTGGPGCAACHGAGKTPSLDCVTCHPTYPVPDSAHASHVSTVTAAVITINGTSWGSHSCSECHSPLDLQTIHGGASSCAKCHPNPASTVTSGTFACAQAGCHVTAAGNMLAQHAAVNASHTTTSTPTCVGTGCHTGGTDVAAIHGVTGGPGCAACHGVGKTPSLDCVTCHPTYPSPDTLHGSHVSTVTAAVITINGTSWGSHSCSECHSPLDLQTIHGGASSCVKCHPSPASTVTSGTFACAQAGCHITPSGNMLAQHAAINASHTTTSTPSCIAAGCHTGGTDVAAIHGVTGGPGCAACHGPGVTPTLVCASTGCHATGATPIHSSHVSTVTAAVITINGTPYGSHSCSECHTSLDLQTIHGGASSCAKCHPSPAASVPKGSFTCAQGGCHITPSGNMLAQHAAINASHTTTSTPTCVGTGCHTGGTDVAAIHAVTGGPGCAACHGAGITPTLVCVTCHPTYPAGSGAHASHVSTVTAGTITINGTTYGPRNCSDCHSTMDLQKVTRHTNCATCHPSPASSLPFGYFACNQNGCHGGTTTGTAIVQHGNADASHTVTLSGNSAQCTQPGCHVGAVTGGKSDLAAIHNAPKLHTVTPDTCLICHSAGTKAPSSCSTTGCHSSGDAYPLLAYSATSSVVPHVNEVSKHQAPVDGGCNLGGYCHGACQDCHPSCGDLPDYQYGQGGDLPAYHAVGARVLGDTGGATLTGCTTCHTPGQSGTKDCWSATCHDMNAMNMP